MHCFLIMNKMSIYVKLFKKKEYYCDGICEICDKGKLYKDRDGEYYTCDPKKVKGLKIIAPVPPKYKNFKEDDYDVDDYFEYKRIK